MNGFREAVSKLKQFWEKRGYVVYELKIAWRELSNYARYAQKKKRKIQLLKVRREIQRRRDDEGVSVWVSTVGSEEVPNMEAVETNNAQPILRPNICGVQQLMEFGQPW